MSVWQRFLNGFFPKKSDGVGARISGLTAKRLAGNKGEDHAAELLKRRGDKIVDRNWSCKSGELDLVTWDKETLVFVEVRTRGSNVFGTPAESVDFRKQEKIRRAAQAFLSSRFGGKRLPACRYDVVSIVAKGDQILEAGIIEGAFV